MRSGEVFAVWSAAGASGSMHSSQGRATLTPRPFSAVRREISRCSFIIASIPLSKGCAPHLERLALGNVLDERGEFIFVAGEVTGEILDVAAVRTFQPAPQREREQLIGKAACKQLLA